MFISKPWLMAGAEAFPALKDRPKTPPGCLFQNEESAFLHLVSLFRSAVSHPQAALLEAVRQNVTSSPAARKGEGSVHCTVTEPDQNRGFGG